MPRNALLPITLPQNTKQRWLHFHLMSDIFIQGQRQREPWVVCVCMCTAKEGNIGKI